MSTSGEGPGVRAHANRSSPERGKHLWSLGPRLSSSLIFQGGHVVRSSPDAGLLPRAGGSLDAE
eukprot:8860389-Pyramimonas_sp.AAC.1